MVEDTNVTNKEILDYCKGVDIINGRILKSKIHFLIWNHTKWETTSRNKKKYLSTIVEESEIHVTLSRINHNRVSIIWSQCSHWLWPFFFLVILILNNAPLLTAQCSTLTIILYISKGFVQTLRESGPPRNHFISYQPNYSFILLNTHLEGTVEML